MATEVVMPKQGNSVEACILLEWKVKVGDAVSVGDILCEAETDKSTIEVESTAGGTVLALLWNEGDEVPVMQPILAVGEAGESYSGSAQAAPVSPAAPETSSPAAEKAAPVVQAPAAQVPATADVAVAASPRAKERAKKEGISLEGIAPTGPKGRLIERDVIQASLRDASLSPAAREMALSSGASIPETGSGIGGRILMKDLLTRGSDSAGPDASQEEVKVIPVKGVRKVTAQRMKESLDSTAQFTLNSYADATGLLALRKKLKLSGEERGLSSVSINDMVMFAVSRTLLQFPFMNAHFSMDSIKEYPHVHLGCAVDTPKGLLVPVITYADVRSLKELSSEAKRLAYKAIDGKAQMEELSGSTFTVTNLGALGVDTFTPVINIPEVAILGVGEIALKAVGSGGEDVKFVPHIGLSLTINHMAVDGAPAARFLKALAQNIADIELTLAL